MHQRVYYWIYGIRDTLIEKSGFSKLKEGRESQPKLSKEINAKSLSGAHLRKMIKVYQKNSWPFILRDHPFGK